MTISEGQVIPDVGQGNNNFPGEFDLEQNYPNPFNPSTTIRYSVPQTSHVTLKVYDMLGQEVATLVDEEQEAGEHEIEFVPKEKASGAYFYRMQARPLNSSSRSKFSVTKKFVLVR
jgi:hypothetical protein